MMVVTDFKDGVGSWVVVSRVGMAFLLVSASIFRVVLLAWTTASVLGPNLTDCLRILDWVMDSFMVEMVLLRGMFNFSHM